MWRSATWGTWHAVLGTKRQAAAANGLAVEPLPPNIVMLSVAMQWKAGAKFRLQTAWQHSHSVWSFEVLGGTHQTWKGTEHLHGGLRACMRLPDMVWGRTKPGRGQVNCKVARVPA